MVVNLTDIDAEIARRSKEATQVIPSKDFTVEDIDAEIARRTEQPPVIASEVVEDKPFLQKFASGIGEFAQGTLSGVENIGLGIIQTAADFGADFDGAKLILSKIRPDLADEISQITSEDVSKSVSRITKRKKDQEKGEGVAFKTGRLAGEVAPFLPVGAKAGLVKGGALAGGIATGVSPLEEEGVTARAEQAAIGASLGAVGGAVGGATLSGLSKVAEKVRSTLLKGESPENITSLVLKQKAGNLFKKATDKGGDLNPSFINDLAKKAQELRPQSKAGKLLEDNPALSKISKDLNELKGERLDLESVKDIDEFLGAKINSLTENGVVKQDGNQLLQLQLELRKRIETITPKEVGGGKEGFMALKSARKLWSKAVRLGDIERIIERAEFSDNPATAIKSGFRALATNPKRLRGFSKTEKELIKNAARTGIITDIFRTFGSRLLPIGTGVAGGGVTSTVGATLGSIASRGVASKSQAIRAEKVVREIIDSSFPNLSKARKANLESRLVKGLKQIPGVSTASTTQQEGK